MTPLAELCWYLSGSNAATAITPYIPEYAQWAEQDGSVFGGYGPRLFGEGDNSQVHNAIEALRRNPSSRRVVLQLLDKEDMRPPRHEDIPCTSTIQLLIRGGALHVVTYMRSNDAWLGLTHDIFAFTMLQELIARSLGVDLGTYTHFVGSLHVYDQHLPLTRAFMDEGYQATIEPMDSMPDGDPWEGVQQLLHAEKQARAAAPVSAIKLPTNAYWADLARLLVAYNLRSTAPSDADALRRAITMTPIRALLDRKTA